MTTVEKISKYFEAKFKIDKDGIKENDLNDLYSIINIIISDKFEVEEDFLYPEVKILDRNKYQYDNSLDTPYPSDMNIENASNFIDIANHNLEQAQHYMSNINQRAKYIFNDIKNEQKSQSLLNKNQLKKGEEVFVGDKAGYVLKVELQEEEPFYTVFYKYPKDYKGLKRKSNQIGVYSIEELIIVDMGNINKFEQTVQNNIKKIYDEYIEEYGLENIYRLEAEQMVEYFIKNKIKPNSDLSKKIISDYFCLKFKYH